MSFSSQNQILSVLLVLVSGLVIGSSSDLCSESGSCATPVDGHHHHHHSCDHHHHHDGHRNKETTMLLPEELAEEEDMRLYGFGPYVHHDHDHDRHHHPQLSGLALWWRALGCSLLVSLASLICLIILPLIFIQGKPSRAVVDSLALFGAGAMLGDAFLHQLPHAFGGEHSHSHDHRKHGRQVQSGLEHQHSHSHSLKDLSVGISVLAGIVLFLIVEKVVRYVQENSGEAISGGHGHHHHHHKSNKKLKDDSDIHAEKEPELSSVKERVSDEISEDTLNGDKFTEPEAHIRKRKISSAGGDDKLNVNAVDGSSTDLKSMEKKESAQSSNLVFGYLNLFSDGVHNFTDGVALGSAFLLYGSVGGWSRTLFLLAHELPQEIGDFGILVRSGFSVSKALFFNFLSALVALVGTAMALLLGQDPGQSSLIEGFTAGGFIYIAIAGVLAEMNNNGSTALKSTAVQLISLMMGMAVALCISLVE